MTNATRNPASQGASSAEPAAASRTVTQVGFALVDVFAARPLTGNPLAVVPDADSLHIEQMRAIAREFNQSETTFLLRPSRAGAQCRLRSFTPAGAEVGGAGHNALGAWLWLAHAGKVGGGSFRQQIGDDLLDVDVETSGDGPARVVMAQSAPRFGAVIQATGPLAAALGLEPDDLDASAAAQVVGTGVEHLLVPLRTRQAVDRVNADPRALLAVLRAAGGEGCYVYATEPGHEQDGSDSADGYTRFFNPTVGISEDPATGTAAGPLAAALVRSGRVPDPGTVTVLQGAVIGRPSWLRLDVAGESVRLSGSGLVVGEGRLAL